ncbi:hypothetical protein JCM4814A_28620 [Streptomyces phaeofaciens JCM 4814]|uniref:Membrane-bound hydrophilic protein n=1 Tax=Streptomyces phaeofaciens TaxID=68254 RepID=A0A918LRI1_9ACTN|nr:hypothetical protein GCM10010226_13960 [Streptomyces phaeofaciens]
MRTGPRHAAPKKPLFTRFHMPAGKAIALAAMPTAVLMGMGFTPTLANAEDQPTSKSLTIDEYKDCVAALDEADASASASPSPTASESTDDAKDDSASDDGSTDDTADDSKDTSSGSGDSSSSDSGSDEQAEPAPAASSEAASTTEQSATSSSGDTATASPSAEETDKNVLETIGDAITDLFDGDKGSDTSTDASPAPSESASASTGTGDSSTDPGSSDGSGSSDDTAAGDSGKDDTGIVKDTTDAVADEVKDAADAADDTADDAADDTADDAAEDTADEATASPSASESATDTDDCPVATLDESGIDNKTPLANDPWYLNASSLLLKGADYQGIVEVKTANGTKKKVLKYVISDGTDIGDLHQTVDDKQAGKTYHVQASSGSTSTIRDGDTIMYTESISGNLFGLIPVTFDPENPPPLNIPLIYFTKVKVVQAGQMGGNLHIPGMHVYTTD